MAKKTLQSPFFFIAACFLLYLVFSLPSWTEPVMGDEVGLMLAGRAVFQKGITAFFVAHGDKLFGIWHPPGFVLTIGALGRMLGVNEVSARLLGISCFLVSLILIYLICGEVFKKGRNAGSAGLWACLIYALNPLAQRGSLLIDMDGTILNTAALFFIWLISRAQYPGLTVKQMLILGLSLSLVMFIKLSTPLLIVGAFLAYLLSIREMEKAKQLIRISCCAVILFSAAWFVYCWSNARDPGDVLFVPLSVLTRFRAEASSLQGWDGFARNAWSVLVWASPSFIILSVVSLTAFFKQGGGRDEPLPAGQLAVYGIASGVIYLFVGGVTHSFPKYHAAVIPVLCIFIGWFLSEKLSFKKEEMPVLFICASGLMLYNIFVVGDPLYGINYRLKEAFILSNGLMARQVLFKEAARFLLIIAALPVAYLFLARKVNHPWLTVLLLTMAGSNMALSFVQANAGYNTVYCYGAKGVRETAAFVRANSDAAEPIIAPTEIKWLANENLLSYVLNKDLRGSDMFIRAMKEHKINCLVYGVTGNSLSQYRNIFNQGSVREFLENGFTASQIGSYTVWLRK